MIYKFIDFQNEHEDYILLMEEYSNTVLFKEIIYFMDLFYPKWKSNYGVGESAAEFMLFLINENEYLNFEKNSNKKTLIKLYESIVYNYNNFKDRYQYRLLNIIDNKVAQIYEEEFYELETDDTISTKDYLAYYKMAKEKFKEFFMDEKTYNFINPII